MLAETERKILAEVAGNDLERYLDGIIANERLSGSQGETAAAQYICQELSRDGIDANIRYFPSLLSNPLFCRLEYEHNASWCVVPAKTRSFGASTGGKPVEGEIIYIAADDLPGDLLTLTLEAMPLPELAGKIVLSEAASPVAILACAHKGASAYIQCWRGKEKLIHEGIFNPIWGTPSPGEADLYPPIPIAAVNGDIGSMIKEAAQSGAKARIITVLDETVTAIPAVEAVITPVARACEYLLIGNHLDSWFYGATDNGTGNALALLLAKLLHRNRDSLRYGVKILWWSGHSNGRYAGSALYARENFRKLTSQCLAYMNIDMPGLRGACDYSKITAGMDLFALAQTAVFDTTEVLGNFHGPIRGWDQSFQNIGISPYFVWASTLPSGHQDTTNGSFMSWWWHTEQDVKDYYDLKVLHKDARLYLLAALRLLSSDAVPFNVNSLLNQVNDQLEQITQRFSHVFGFKDCRESMLELIEAYRVRSAKDKLDVQASIFLVRKLNRLLYVEKESYMQDYALEQGFLPGLAPVHLLENRYIEGPKELMLRNYLSCQTNRFADLCYTAIDFLQHK